MSSWANLYNLASSWVKRPAVWLGGFLAAAAGTYVTTNLMPPVQTFLSEKTAEKACQYRQKPVPVTHSLRFWSARWRVIRIDRTQRKSCGHCSAKKVSSHTRRINS